MPNRTQLLHWETDSLQNWLNAFDASLTPRVTLGSSMETLLVRCFPLPEGFSPDYLDIALILRSFPSSPPVGLYMKQSERNHVAIERLKRKFNVFHGTAYHGAPAMLGYEWICVGYTNGWKYNTQSPNQGDNITKMMMEFWRLLND